MRNKRTAISVKGNSKNNNKTLPKKTKRQQVQQATDFFHFAGINFGRDTRIVTAMATAQLPKWRRC